MQLAGAVGGTIISPICHAEVQASQHYPGPEWQPATGDLLYQDSVEETCELLLMNMHPFKSQLHVVDALNLVMLLHRIWWRRPASWCWGSGPTAATPRTASGRPRRRRRCPSSRTTPRSCAVGARQGLWHDAPCSTAPCTLQHCPLQRAGCWVLTLDDSMPCPCSNSASSFPGMHL